VPRMSGWLDRAVPAASTPDAESLRRARLTVVLSGVLVVTAAVYALFYGLVVGFREGALITAVGGGVATVALAALHGRPTLQPLGHALTWVLYAVIVALVWFSGGVASPVTPWLILPPMFAALLLGAPSAAAWTAACVATVAAYFAAERLGVRFAVGFAPAWALPVTAASFAGLITCSAVLLFVFEDIRARAQQRAEAARAALARLAYHDALTGLTNRARFLECVDAALARAKAAGEPGRVALLYCDLDGFKTVNDSLGHAAGDVLLVEVASRLLNATRGCDTVARLGGDEFAVLIDNLRHDGDAATVADRIVASLALPFRIGGQEARVGTSIGVARAPAASVAVLLHDADVAMYRAKALGKGRWVRYEAGLQDAPPLPPAPTPDRRHPTRGHLGLA
jgi:diguanylate cyclase (GGDEF)-like protein